MPERFTQEQKLLADCMKLLIKIYYVEENSLRKYWEDASIELMENLFGTIFGNCTYDHDIRKFATRLHSGIKGPIFELDENDKLSFINIMRILEAEIKDNCFHHFDILGVESQLLSNFSDTRAAYLNKSQSPLILSKKQYTPYFITGEGRKEIRQLRNKALPLLTGVLKRQIGELEIATIKYTKMKVLLSRGSVFARDIVNLEPLEDPIVNIPVILWPHDNFIRLFRSILVHFHIAFGNYRRLKVCQNDNCGHIHFENRKNRLKFCGVSCKSACFRREDPEKLKCQGRQNNWIRYKLSKLPDQPTMIYKDTCTECKAVMKGGKCPVMLEKNSTFIELLQSTSKKFKK